MVHQIVPERSRGHLRALTRVALALAFLFVTVAEGSHSHDGAAGYLPACAVCELTHNAAPAIGTAPSTVAGLDILWAPIPPEQRQARRAPSLSSHRSRAPPTPISS